MMICNQLTSMLGFDCFPLTEGGEVALISTPFKFDDGDALPVFVEVVNGRVRFFDDGATLRHFLGRGVRIDNKKHIGFITSATAKHGAVLNDAGEIEAWGSKALASEAFARFMSSLVALATWEREQQGVDTDASVFVEEVAMALRAWKPSAAIALDPDFQGISGKMHKLDFLIDGQAIIATSTHPNKIAAVLHRLLDIHGQIANDGIRILVVVDDRQDPVAAKKEASIMQSVASVMTFTSLERNAATPVLMQ